MSELMQELERALSVLKLEHEAQKATIARRDHQIFDMQQNAARREDEVVQLHLDLAAAREALKTAHDVISSQISELEAKQRIMEDLNQKLKEARFDATERERQFAEIREAFEKLQGEYNRFKGSSTAKEQFETLWESLFIERGPEMARPIEEKYRLMQILCLSQISSELANLRRLLIETATDPVTDKSM